MPCGPVCVCVCLCVCVQCVLGNRMCSLRMCSLVDRMCVCMCDVFSQVECVLSDICALWTCEGFRV